MEWVSVHLMADTQKSKTWRLYKTGITVKISQRRIIITKLQTETAVNLFSFSARRSSNTQPIQYHQQVVEMASLREASVIPTGTKVIRDPTNNLNDKSTTPYISKKDKTHHNLENNDQKLSKKVPVFWDGAQHTLQMHNDVRFQTSAVG